jgi:hypothetical protein
VAAMLTCLPIDIFYFDAAPLGGVIRRFFYTHRLISGIVIYWKTDGVSCRSIEYFEDDHGVIEGDGIEESNESGVSRCRLWHAVFARDQGNAKGTSADC